MSLLLHPSVINSAQLLIHSFMALTDAQQIVLLTLVKVKMAARENTPITDNLLGVMRVIGTIPPDTPPRELDRASSEIYTTLQIMTAHQNGSPPVIEHWFRDII